MSSLTDIIFLLLIFFVLTSKFVNENGFKLQLPEGVNETLSQHTLDLVIEKDQTMFISQPETSRDEAAEVSMENLEAELSKRLDEFGEFGATVVIKSDQDIPIKVIANVMTVGARIKQRVILATEQAK